MLEMSSSDPRALSIGIRSVSFAGDGDVVARRSRARLLAERHARVRLIAPIAIWSGRDLVRTTLKRFEAAKRLATVEAREAGRRERARRRRRGLASISAVPLPMIAALEQGERRWSAKILTTPGGAGARRARGDRRGARRSRHRPGRFVADHPRHDSGDQRDHRAQSQGRQRPRSSRPKASGTLIEIRHENRLRRSNTTSTSTCRRLWCRAGCALPGP